MWAKRIIDSERRPLILASGLSLLCLAGCVGMGTNEIRLMHDALATPTAKAPGQIVMQKTAEDLRATAGRIGHATMTVFAIESGTVTTYSPVEEEVVSHVKEALESVGYQVTLVEPKRVALKPSRLVKVEIREFSFKNYNWVWPIVPTWGTIELGLVVETAEGRTQFDRSFRGTGSSFCLTGECAFGAATKEALTNVLDQIVQTASSEHFRLALQF